MTNLRLKLANCLHWLGRQLDNSGYAGDFYATPIERTDAVVNANVEPKWTPQQDGQVVIAEPKLVTMERAQRGDEAVQHMLDEL